MAGERDFSHFKTVQNDSGAHHSSSPLGCRVLSQLGEADHSPPSGGQVKNALHCASICDIL